MPGWPHGRATWDNRAAPQAQVPIKAGTELTIRYTHMLQVRLIWGPPHTLPGTPEEAAPDRGCLVLQLHLREVLRPHRGGLLGQCSTLPGLQVSLVP